jgi:hypothetical protein
MSRRERLTPGKPKLRLRNMQLSRKLQVSKLNMMLKQPVLLQKVRQKLRLFRLRLLLRLKVSSRRQRL